MRGVREVGDVSIMPGCDCVSCKTVTRWRDLWRRGVLWRMWAEGSRDLSAARAMLRVL